MRRSFAAPLPLIVVAALAAGCGSGPSGTAAGSHTSAGPSSLSAATDTSTTTSVTLNGAGANSIDPFFESVFYAYHAANAKTTVNYSPAGSSVGISDIEQGTVDFGDSEIPMPAKDLAQAKGAILQLPVDLGGVAVSYNLPGASTHLKLDGTVLAEIFDGSITRWNDPRIAAVTGDSSLPNTRIVAVHRADTSGPGWDLDQYLIKTSPAWVHKIGTTTPSTAWPEAQVGVGEQLNSGVATYIKQTPGAIGYIEYGYAKKAGMATAAVKNAAGAFVAPSESSIAAAGSHASGLSSTNFVIIDEPGASSYPLANFSWTLLYQRQGDTAKGLALGKLFDYVITTGQKYAGALGYAPLPSNAVHLAESTLRRLENSGGSPLFTQ